MNYLRFLKRLRLEETFTISVMHKGVEKELTGRLRISAYTHQFLFTVGGAEIILEKDDEGKFRVLNSSVSSGPGQNPDASLIRALVEEMEKLMKN
jgi:hypothetical protein